MLLDDASYRKEYPPIEKVGQKVIVEVSTFILKMSKFDDLAMSYNVKFVVQLKWLDPNVRYANLKENYLENLVSEEKKRSIWIPPLTFNNTKGNKRISVDEPSSQVFVEKKGHYKVAPLSDILETLYYSGSENYVVLNTEYELNFNCYFDLHCFPFDTQVCGMEVRYYLFSGHTQDL